jgi:hypothetical protein
MGARTVRAASDLLGPAKTPKVPKRHRHAHDALRHQGERHRRYGRFRLLPAHSLKRLSPCVLRAAGDMLAISLKRLGPVVYCFVSVRGGGARALARPVTVTEGPQKIFF